ncbi:glycosyltransferase family 2 protein [Candidatus Nomurabacteria bacterium]|nr:glycosyltransferase family 2 protein [Candidatus Nomurabacteria bacterium]
MSQKILISIPAKNEAQTITEVINSCRQQVLNHTGITADVLVVSDGSTDDTVELAKSARADVIVHHRSQGLGYVFSEAIEYAVRHDHDIMITIDGDNQFDTEDIPAMLNPILENEADFVTGSRFLSNSKLVGIPEVKKIGNRMMSKLISSILKEKFYDVSCGFRVYNKEAILNLNVFHNFTYTQEVFLNLGVKKIRIKEIPISVQYFKERKSRIASNLFRYGWQTLKIITRSVVHYKPMRLFGTFSLITFLISFPIVVTLGIRYIRTDLITPYKGIAISAIVVLVVSMASLVSGIILEIISRIQLSIEKAIYYLRRNRS